MSELKTRFIDDTYAEYYNTGKHELAQIYLKSEADKVIAEKDKVIAKLKEIDSKNRSAYYKDLAMMAKDVEHHKYKRCLAMAKIAQDDWHLHNSFYAMGHQEFEKRKCKFYEKWRKRWMELAEKFKEAR